MISSLADEADKSGVVDDCAGARLRIEKRLFCTFEEDHFVLKYRPTRPTRQITRLNFTCYFQCHWTDRNRGLSTYAILCQSCLDECFWTRWNNQPIRSLNIRKIVSVKEF